MWSYFLKSETFEYVRLDKEYRYVSEQVSHHPPISACWAESPNWHYFGEVWSMTLGGGNEADWSAG